jgi:hypothetical protein
MAFGGEYIVFSAPPAPASLYMDDDLFDPVKQGTRFATKAEAEQEIAEIVARQESGSLLLYFKPRLGRLRNLEIVDIKTRRAQEGLAARPDLSSLEAAPAPETKLDSPGLEL